MDKFPEAFSRFEEKVDTSKFQEYGTLKNAFINWGKKKWKGTRKQEKALDSELEKKQFITKIEVITYKKTQRKQVIRRDRYGRFAKKQ